MIKKQNYFSLKFCLITSIFLLCLNLATAGNIIFKSGNINLGENTTGNITAKYFIGDGSQLANVSSWNQSLTDSLYYYSSNPDN